MKYSEKGETRSSAHAAVVRNDNVRYARDTTGMSMYHSSGSPAFMVAADANTSAALM